ncbi:MAG: zinc-ribbon domain-containing protein [Candidatus Hodarchaeales archaeon]|jgi:DNA repair exonuclease SbcCD ATPase subunit
MSQTTYCTNCGKDISVTARFCRFCGTPIKKSRSSTPISEPAPQIPTEPPTPSRRHFTPPTETVEQIPDEILNNLYARKRKSEIKIGLKDLLKEIDELTKKVEIGLITETESADMISKIQTDISTLQEEQKSLQSRPLELETLSEEEEKWQKRLEKIEEKKRAQAVSNDVYSSLRDEYASELASVQQKVATEERKARRWLVDLQKGARELETSIERLKVRGEIEGLSKEQLEEKLKDQKLLLSKKAIAADVLTEVLSSL